MDYYWIVNNSLGFDMSSDLCQKTKSITRIALLLSGIS